MEDLDIRLNHCVVHNFDTLLMNAFRSRQLLCASVMLYENFPIHAEAIFLGHWSGNSFSFVAWDS